MSSLKIFLKHLSNAVIIFTETIWFKFHNEVALMIRTSLRNIFSLGPQVEYIFIIYLMMLIFFFRNKTWDFWVKKMFLVYKRFHSKSVVINLSVTIFYVTKSNIKQP